MQLELEIEEVGSILNLLNETPTKMGYYPICVKIAAQLNAQLPVEQLEVPPLQKASD
jgi:hypothetical protein